MALCAVLGVGSCSVDSPSGPEYTPPHLFDTSYGFNITSTPASPAVGDTLHLVLDATPRATGVGHVSLHGLGMGAGDALSPVTGEVGKISYPVRFDAGSATTVEWVILVDTPLDVIGIDCFMGFDSVEINGSLYTPTSLEAWNEFGPELAYSIVKYIALPVAARAN